MNPTSTPAEKEGAVFHQTAAALCAFSPFVALTFNVFVGAILSVANFAPSGPLALAGGGLVLIVVLFGIVAGIVALSGIPRHGSGGILAKVVIGLSLQGFLLAVALPDYLKGREQSIVADQVSRASVRYFANRALEVRQFDAQSKKLRDAEVVNFIGVTNKTQFAARRAKVNDFVAANTRLKEFFLKGELLYRAELVKQGVSDRWLEAEIAEYRRTSMARDALGIRLREQDEVIAKAMLDLIKLMEDRWGYWRPASGRMKIIFEKDIDLESYRMFFREIDRASDAQKDLRKQASTAK